MISVSQPFGQHITSGPSAKHLTEHTGRSSLNVAKLRRNLKNLTLLEKNVNVALRTSFLKIAKIRFTISLSRKTWIPSMEHAIVVLNLNFVTERSLTLLILCLPIVRHPVLS